MRRFLPALVLLLLTVPGAAALALPPPVPLPLPVPEPVQRVALAADRIVTSTVHEALAPLEPPQEPVRPAAADAEPVTQGGAPWQEAWVGAAEESPGLAMLSYGVALGVLLSVLAVALGRVLAGRRARKAPRKAAPAHDPAFA